MLIRQRRASDDGVSLTELMITVVILSLIMTMLFQWIVSSQNAATAAVTRGDKETELLLVHEFMSRDVRSARRLNGQSASSAIKLLSETHLELYSDRDLDGIPNLIVWDLTNGDLTRVEYLGQAGTGPNWTFEASPDRTMILVTKVTSAAIFSAWSESQGTVTSCDDSVSSLLCQLQRLDLDLDAEAMASPQSLVELETSYAFRREVQ